MGNIRKNQALCFSLVQAALKCQFREICDSTRFETGTQSGWKTHELWTVVSFSKFARPNRPRETTKTPCREALSSASFFWKKSLLPQPIVVASKHSTTDGVLTRATSGLTHQPSVTW